MAWFKKRCFDAKPFMRTRARGSPSWLRASLVRPDTFAQTFRTIFKFILQTGRAIRFKRRPALGLPLPNRRLIALHRTFRRPLAGEAQPLEQPPHARLAISLTGEHLDQLANPPQGPQIAAVSLRQRSCLQRRNKAFLIIRIQQRWPTGAGCTTQAAPPARCQRLLPPSHRSSAHT